MIKSLCGFHNASESSEIFGRNWFRCITIANIHILLMNNKMLLLNVLAVRFIDIHVKIVSYLIFLFFNWTIFFLTLEFWSVYRNLYYNFLMLSKVFFDLMACHFLDRQPKNALLRGRFKIHTIICKWIMNRSFRCTNCVLFLFIIFSLLHWCFICKIIWID